MAETDYCVHANAYGQYLDDIDPGHCESDDEDVWNQASPVDRILGCAEASALTYYYVHDGYGQCCRSYDFQIDLELVGHQAALCLGGGDRGVGDEREIVPEECSSGDDGSDETCVKP